MRSQKEIIGTYCLMVERIGIDGGCGRLYLNGTKGEPMIVVWSFSGGWEHVSVSYRHKMPTWDEMCRVKDLFWHEEETVVQFHPKKSEYVNNYPFCLHLWRKLGQDFELPPKWFV